MAETTRPIVISITDIRDEERNYTNPDTKPLVLTCNWSKTQYAIQEWLLCYQGTKKTPLAYVCRDNINPPAEAPNPSTNNETVEDEMITRAPINTTPGIYYDSFKIDSKVVWDHIADLLRDTKAWVQIKSHQRARDGRAALLDLKDFYLGPNMVNEMAAAAEAQSTRSKYNGESKCWTFDSYVAVHLAQHKILADLVKHGYQMMGKGNKVRHLTQGIKTDALNVIKDNILATLELQRDFDSCMSLFKYYIASNQASKELNLNISETNTDIAPVNNNNQTGRGGGQGRGRGRGSHGDRGGGNCDGNKPKINSDGKRKRDENDSDGSEISYRYHT